MKCTTNKEMVKEILEFMRTDENAFFWIVDTCEVMKTSRKRLNRMNRKQLLSLYNMIEVEE